MNPVWQTPDTIFRLRRASELRLRDGVILMDEGRYTSAVYLFGYAVEMILGAAYFSAIGQPLNGAISRDLRREKMTQARNTIWRGEKVMTGDPHDLIGWARFLSWVRIGHGSPPKSVAGLMEDIMARSRTIYFHWRPELRYKVGEIPEATVAEIRSLAEWFVRKRENF